MDVSRTPTPGRPRTKIDIEQLIVRMAMRIPVGATHAFTEHYSTSDIKIGRGTIRRILKEHLIEPDRLAAGVFPGRCS